MVKKKFTTTKRVKGRLYQYFRKDGRYVRLLDDPSSEEYDREYRRLMRGGGALSQRFTFEKLIKSSMHAPKWARLAPLTNSDYSKVLV
ncbi:MAG: integrase, partial [Leisingera sp.]